MAVLRGKEGMAKHGTGGGKHFPIAAGRGGPPPNVRNAVAIRTKPKLDSASSAERAWRASSLYFLVKLILRGAILFLGSSLWHLQEGFCSQAVAGADAMT